MKNIIYIIFLAHISCAGNKDEFYSYNKNREYAAIILDIYRDRKNHDLYRFKISTSESDIYASYYHSSWKYASIGDSIVKKKGNSFITIKKKDGSSKIFEMEI